MGILWENTTPSTELPRDFCAGIGPLQLGVVLVLFFNNFKSSRDKTKLLGGKEAESYKIFSDIIDLKIQPLVTTQRID